MVCAKFEVPSSSSRTPTRLLFAVAAFAAQRLDQRGVGGRLEHLAGVQVEHLARDRLALLVAVHLQAGERVRHQHRRVLGLEPQRAPVAAQGLGGVIALQALLGALEPLRGLALDPRQRHLGASREVADQIAVAHLLRVEALRLAERLERLAPPVAVEVGEPEQVMSLLERGIEPGGVAQRADRGQLSRQVVVDAAQQVVGLRHRLGAHRALEEGGGLLEPAFAGVDRAQAEQRQEGVGVDLDAALEERLGAPEVAELVLDDAAVDQAVVVVGLEVEDAREIAQRLLGVALVEPGLAQEVGELVVGAVERVGGLERLDRRFELEREEVDLGLAELTQERVAPLAAVERLDAVAAGGEALPLLEREQLALRAHLPGLAPDLGLDHALDLERVGQRVQAGVVDEEVLLLLLQRRQDVAHGLGGALEHLLQHRDALEQVLVEREVVLGPLLLELDLLGAGARDHQQLLVAAVAVLGLVVLQRAADLTEHG